MDAFITTLRMGQLYQDNTSLWDRYGVSGDSALDSYVELTRMPNVTESINSQGAFTVELESLPTSTTLLESDFAESVLPLSLGIASNSVSINSSNVDWLTGIAVDAAYVGDLKNGSDITLTTSGNFDNSRLLDKLTADGTVSLAPSTNNSFIPKSVYKPPFCIVCGELCSCSHKLEAYGEKRDITGTWWKVSQDSVGIITLQNQGAIQIKDYHVRDGLTVDVKVNLAPSTPSTNNSFTSILGKFSQVNDLVVTLENKRATPSENSSFKNELTVDAKVSLAPHTDTIYSGTQWKVSQVNEGIITLQNQGFILTKDSRLLNELTTERTVSLAPSTFNPFISTSWKVSQVTEGIITLQKLGAILTKDSHVWDGFTKGTVSLTPSTFNPSTSTQWKSQVNDLIITLENKRTIPSGNYHVWDGLKADRTVNLTPSTNNPFISTKERVFNIQNEFRSDNPIIEESRENVTPKFFRKVFGILERLNTVPENSIAVIGSETGGSYSSSERNDLSESVSLIQFTDNGVQHSSTRGLASR